MKYSMAILTTLLAFLALAGPPQADLHARGARPAPAEVERLRAGRYRIDFGRSLAGPVDIFVAGSPDAPTSERRRIVVAAQRSATFEVNTPGRPYFFLQPRKGKGQWVAERLLPLEGGRNFRDLGGYRSIDGRHVRWGLLYRSGAMTDLSIRDYEYLGRLGIRSVCDFRTNGERREQPNKWAETAHIAYWTRDYEMSGGDLRSLFQPGAKPTPQKIRMQMIALYRSLPYEAADGYREMFRQMLAGQLPLAFNCTAGKDRTGIAAALILTALGVPRDAVVADYALTDRYLPLSMAQGRATIGSLSRMPPELSAPILAADPAYLSAALDEMTRRDGSPQHYLEKTLGLTSRQQLLLKQRLLE